MIRFLLLAIALGGSPAGAAESTGFIDRVYRDANGEHRYVVYVPGEYTPERKWPVILYLHGAGGRGDDGRRQLADGLAPVIRTRGDFPAIVVMPQCHETHAPILTSWVANSPDARRALAILDEIEHTYSCDPQRRVLAGWSMGGYGAWSVAAAHPELWAGVVAVSGGGNQTLAPRLAHVPIWAIHGGADRAIVPQESRSLAGAARAAGGDVVYSELDGIGHDVWKYAFSSPRVTDWMCDPGGVVRDGAGLRQDAAELLASGAVDALSGEFRPAMIIPRAISLRLGRDALAVLAEGLPATIDSEMLSGPLDDAHFSFDAGGESYEVSQTELTYEARLARMMLDTLADGRVRLMLGLEPLLLRIGRTHVESPTRRAEIGPLEVRVGHRRPVWLDLTLAPEVRDHRLELAAVGARFQIQNDNWLVQPPTEIEVAGPDITPDLVRTAVVGGLYVRKSRIEDSILGFVPRLVDRIEQKFEPRGIDSVVNRVWPLPVFRPRLRINVDDVAVDPAGISVSIGLAAAPFNLQQPPTQPVVIRPYGPAAVDIPKSRGLEVGVSPSVMEPLSQMLVDAGAARINASDLPESEFAVLNDREQLLRVLPELEAMGPGLEIRSEISLQSPFIIEPAPHESVPVAFTTDRAQRGEQLAAAQAANEVAEGRQAARFAIPKLMLSVALRPSAETDEWTPYAEFEIHLAQGATIMLLRPSYQRREIELLWTGAPKIAVAGGRRTHEAVAADPDYVQLQAMIEEAWLAWTADTPQTRFAIPDVDIGSGRLRLERLNWRGPQFVARYEAPATRIVNDGDREVTYAVRGSATPWSEVWKLEPGQHHDFEVPYALTLRRRERDPAPLAIPTGSLVHLGDGPPRFDAAAD